MSVLQADSQRRARPYPFDDSGMRVRVGKERSNAVTASLIVGEELRRRLTQRVGLRRDRKREQQARQRG